MDTTTAAAVVCIRAPSDALEHVRRMMSCAAQQKRQMWSDHTSPLVAAEELDHIEQCLRDLQFAIMDEMADDDAGGLDAQDVVSALNNYYSMSDKLGLLQNSALIFYTGCSHTNVSKAW